MFKTSPTWGGGSYGPRLTSGPPKAETGRGTVPLFTEPGGDPGFPTPRPEAEPWRPETPGRHHAQARGGGGGCRRVPALHGAAGGAKGQGGSRQDGARAPAGRRPPRGDGGKQQFPYFILLVTHRAGAAVIETRCGKRCGSSARDSSGPQRLSFRRLGIKEKPFLGRRPWWGVVSFMARPPVGCGRHPASWQPQPPRPVPGPEPGLSLSPAF